MSKTNDIFLKADKTKNSENVGINTLTEDNFKLDSIRNQSFGKFFEGSTDVNNVSTVKMDDLTIDNLKPFGQKPLHSDTQHTVGRTSYNMPTLNSTRMSEGTRRETESISISKDNRNSRDSNATASLPSTISHRDLKGSSYNRGDRIERNPLESVHLPTSHSSAHPSHNNHSSLNSEGSRFRTSITDTKRSINTAGTNSGNISEMYNAQLTIRSEEPKRVKPIKKDTETTNYTETGDINTKLLDIHRTLLDSNYIPKSTRDYRNIQEGGADNTDTETEIGSISSSSDSVESIEETEYETQSRLPNNSDTNTDTDTSTTTSTKRSTLTEPTDTHRTSVRSESTKKRPLPGLHRVKKDKCPPSLETDLEHDIDEDEEDDSSSSITNSD